MTTAVKGNGHLITGWRAILEVGIFTPERYPIINPRCESAAPDPISLGATVPADPLEVQLHDLALDRTSLALRLLFAHPPRSLQ